MLYFEAPTIPLLGMSEAPIPYEMIDTFVSKDPKLFISAEQFVPPVSFDWHNYSGIESTLSISDTEMQQFYAAFPQTYATTVSCRAQFAGQAPEEKVFMPVW